MSVDSESREHSSRRFGAPYVLVPDWDDLQFVTAVVFESGC